MSKHHKSHRVDKPDVWNLKIDFRISWYVNELVKKLHAEYPWTERSAMARIEKKQWYYIMTDVRFAEQENSVTNTEMTKEGIAKLTEEILAQDPRQIQEFNCWLHSHHSMSCFWSWTDDEAKASFNDGNTKFFFSVVTAYKWDRIDYKCALDIYKPVRIELDIPVSVEARDEEKFYRETIKEYALMNKAIENLAKKRDEKLMALSVEWVVNENNVNELMSIMNVEDNEENAKIIIDLLDEQNAEAAEALKEAYIKEFEDNKSETITYFQWDTFEKKIRELKDAIKKPSYSYSKGYDWEDHNRRVAEKAKNKKKTKWGFFQEERDDEEDEEVKGRASLWDEDIEDRDYTKETRNEFQARKGKKYR